MTVRRRLTVGVLLLCLCATVVIHLRAGEYRRAAERGSRHPAGEASGPRVHPGMAEVNESFSPDGIKVVARDIREGKV